MPHHWSSFAKNEIKTPNISIGCDPEVFLRSKETGKVVSAHNLLPGTKQVPHPVSGGAVQVDGVSAEFNIDPTYDPHTWTLLIQQVTTNLRGMVKGYDLQIIPAYEFEKAYFDTLPASAKTLGCDPDFCAWTGKQNPEPDRTTTLRAAAGHIHGGWTKNEDPYGELHFMDCCAIVKQLDYYVGMYELLWNGDGRRRAMYGKAGAFRTKPYGVEYRTPSNTWLRYPKLHPWIWNSTHAGIRSMFIGAPRLYDEFGDLARQVIDNNNVDFVRSQEFKKIHKMTGQPWPQW